MIKTKRADKKKSLDKTAASLVKNPLQTARELEKTTGLGASTVNRARNELAQTGTKDDRIISLTDKDFELMQLIQERKFSRMADKESPVNDSDVNNWDKTAQARYTLFRGEATDNKGGLKDTTAIDKLNSVIGSE